MTSESRAANCGKPLTFDSKPLTFDSKPLTFDSKPLTAGNLKENVYRILFSVCRNRKNAAGRCLFAWSKCILQDYKARCLLPDVKQRARR